MVSNKHKLVSASVGRSMCKANFGCTYVISKFKSIKNRFQFHNVRGTVESLKLHI